MSRMWVVAASVVMVALAGCSDDGGGAAVPKCDPVTEYQDAQGVCVEHTEPNMIVEGLPPQVQQFLGTPFTWSLDNGTRGTAEDPVHSMDSRVLASLEDGPVTNATGPDEWGEEVAREQHKNFPAGPFDGRFSWDETGMVYLKGYMLIEGKNVWQDLGTVEVTEVQPTGVVANVTITQGPPPELGEGQTGITVGDAVKWVNENALYGYTITFECGSGVTVDPVSVAAGGESEAVAFLMPTSCDYTAATEASGSGVTQGDLTGTININKP